VRNINAEGEEEPEEELSQEEIVAGLQLMFTEKHGRAANEDEVKEWLGAISGLKGSDFVPQQEQEQEQVDEKA
jgi:hypothetical protein